MREIWQRRLTAFVATGVIAGMLGLTAAAVPLYRLFCQVTGYGGTTQRAEQAPESVADRTIRVLFNADVAQGMPWSFAPAARAIEVRIGEQTLAFYRAHNSGSRPITGTASFTEQVLDAGASADLPVSFFVDPAILDDPFTRDVRSITLSYTFFPRDDGPEASDDRPSS